MQKRHEKAGDGQAHALWVQATRDDGVIIACKRQISEPKEWSVCWTGVLLVIQGCRSKTTPILHTEFTPSLIAPVERCLNCELHNVWACCYSVLSVLFFQTPTECASKPRNEMEIRYEPFNQLNKSDSFYQMTAINEAKYSKVVLLTTMLWIHKMVQTIIASTETFLNLIIVCW